MRREIRPFLDLHIPQIDTNRVWRCHLTLDSEISLLLAFRSFPFGGFVRFGSFVSVLSFQLFRWFRLRLFRFGRFARFGRFISVVSVVSFRWFCFAVSGFSTCLFSALLTDCWFQSAVLKF